MSCRCFSRAGKKKALLALRREEVEACRAGLQDLQLRDLTCRAELASQQRRLSAATAATESEVAASEAAMSQADELLREVAAAEVRRQEAMEAQLRRDARSARLGALRSRLLGLQAEHRQLRARLATPPWQQGQDHLMSGLQSEAKSLSDKLADRLRLNRCIQDDLKAQKESSAALMELGDQETQGLSALREQNDGLEAEVDDVMEEVLALQESYWQAVPFQGLDAAELTRLQRSIHVGKVVTAKLEKDLECERRLGAVAEIEAEEAAACVLTCRAERQEERAARRAEALEASVRSQRLWEEEEMRGDGSWAVKQAERMADDVWVVKEVAREAAREAAREVSREAARAATRARSRSPQAPPPPLPGELPNSPEQLPSQPLLLPPPPRRWGGPRRWGAEFAEMLQAVSRAAASDAKRSEEEAAAVRSAEEAEARHRREAEDKAQSESEAARANTMLAEVAARELVQAEARNIDLKEEIQQVKEQLEQQQLRQEITALRGRMLPELPGLSELRLPPLTAEELRKEQLEQSRLRQQIAARANISAGDLGSESPLLQRERREQQQLLRQIAARAASVPRNFEVQLLREQLEQERLRHELSTRTTSLKARSPSASDVMRRSLASSPARPPNCLEDPGDQAGALVMASRAGHALLDACGIPKPCGLLVA